MEEVVHVNGLSGLHLVKNLQNMASVVDKHLQHAITEVLHVKDVAGDLPLDKPLVPVGVEDP